MVFIPDSSLFGKMFRGLTPIMTAVAVAFSTIIYLKMLVQRKNLRFLSWGFERNKTYTHSTRDFSSRHEGSSSRDYTYEKVSGLSTIAGKAFLSFLTEIIGDRYLIQGKVRLADLISPESTLDNNLSKWAFRRISQKHVDFVICDRQNFQILGVVEFDDKSHLRPDRIARDKFVDAAFSAVGIPILHYPVKFNYESADINEKLVEILGIELDHADDENRLQTVGSVMAYIPKPKTNCGGHLAGLSFDGKGFAG